MSLSVEPGATGKIKTKTSAGFSADLKTQSADSHRFSISAERSVDVTYSYSPTFSEILRTNHTITPDMLSFAMDRAQLWQVPLGNVLVADGHMQCQNLYSDYSKSLQLPLVNFSSFGNSTGIETEKQLDYLMLNQLVLLHNGPVPVYASASLDLPQNPQSRHQSFPHGHCAAIITPRDHRAFFLTRYRKVLTARATMKLARWAPEFSARMRISQFQLLFLLLAITLLATLGVLWTDAVLFGSNLLFALWFSALIALRAAALAYAPVYERTNRNGRKPAFAEADLPVYSILVPLYRETTVLRQLSDALRALDYPAAKLDVKFLFEEDDRASLEAAKALSLPDNFEIIVVPHALPKTKPKALNLGLQFARGDYVVVYDAEDIPHPQQLLEALYAFRHGPEKLACIQARLNFYNPNDNWLTRQFTIEYSILYDLMLPLLIRLKIPIPLGGTSNHFNGLR